MTAHRNKVGTYLGKRAFYKKDMEKKDRAGQDGRALPPRCAHCRVSWDVTMLRGAPHCAAHRTACLTACEEDLEDSS